MLKFFNDLFREKDGIDKKKEKPKNQLDIRVIGPSEKIGSCWSMIMQSLRVAQGEHKVLAQNVGGDYFLIEIIPGEAYVEYLDDETYKRMLKVWGHSEEAHVLSN